MKNRITSKEQRKAQREQLKEALNAEKSQGAAIRKLKTLHNQYSKAGIFSLSDFQLFIVKNQNELFSCVQHLYGKNQLKKVEQLQRIKEGKELLINTSYSVVYLPKEGIEITQRTFGSREKAKEFQKELPLKNLEIRKNETPINTNFTPAEMLGTIQKIESKFFEQFPNAETATPANVKRALSMTVTEKDKEISTGKNAVKAPVKKVA